jgi:hypothetical protein
MGGCILAAAVILAVGGCILAAAGFSWSSMINTCMKKIEGEPMGQINWSYYLSGINHACMILTFIYCLGEIAQLRSKIWNFLSLLLWQYMCHHYCPLAGWRTPFFLSILPYIGLICLAPQYCLGLRVHVCLKSHWAVH